MIPVAESSERLVPPASLTQVPRHVTPRGRWRSWNELPVRVWVILSLAVLLITIYFTVSTYLSGRYERWLIAHGDPVEAEVLVIEGTRDRRGGFKRSDTLRVQLGYEYQGQRYEYLQTQGLLSRIESRRAPMIFVEDKLPIRVDPSNPTAWTDRSEPLPWYAEFTIVLFLLPLLVVLVLLALIRRYQVMSIWRKGEVAAGVVVDLKHTAVAPFSRIVRFTLADGRDRRVWSTLHPARNVPGPGETLWLVFPSNKPGRAVVADLYE
jgi:hypothetical protein